MIVSTYLSSLSFSYSFCSSISLATNPDQMGHQPQTCLPLPQQDLPCRILPIPPIPPPPPPLTHLGKLLHVQGLSSENQSGSKNQDSHHAPPSQIHHHWGLGLEIWVE